MFYRYYTYIKVKDILKTFEPDNHKMLRTSQPQKFFAGPYKKKQCSRFCHSSLNEVPPLLFHENEKRLVSLFFLLLSFNKQPQKESLQKIPRGPWAGPPQSRAPQLCGGCGPLSGALMLCLNHSELFSFVLDDFHFALSLLRIYFG